jgi:hypothetical protein
VTSAETLTLDGILVTAIGSVAAVVGIVFVWLQVRASRRVAQGEFILRLGELLNGYEPIARVLIQKQWKPDDDGVSLNEMVRYMEMFDQMKILIDYRMIEPAIFQRLFGYRLYFVVMNDYLYRTQLLENSQWWPDTIALSKLTAKHQIVDSDNSFFNWSAFRERVSRLPDV